MARPPIETAGAGLSGGAQIPSVQISGDAQSSVAMQLPPLGTAVLVGVLEGVAVGVHVVVGVLEDVAVGVTVGVVVAQFEDASHTPSGTKVGCKKNVHCIAVTLRQSGPVSRSTRQQPGFIWHSQPPAVETQICSGGHAPSHIGADVPHCCGHSGEPHVPPGTNWEFGRELHVD